MLLLSSQYTAACISRGAGMGESSDGNLISVHRFVFVEYDHNSFVSPTSWRNPAKINRLWSLSTTHVCECSGGGIGWPCGIITHLLVVVSNWNNWFKDSSVLEHSLLGPMPPYINIDESTVTAVWPKRAHGTLFLLSINSHVSWTVREKLYH